nr:hypothetical protein [uncultured bacterium]
MLSGSFEYASETSLTIFKTFVEKNYPIQANLIVYESEDDNPSLAALDDADALLIFTRRLNTEGKSLRQFQAYCEQGRPLVGIRTASHAYQNWLEFDKVVLGGDYQGHYGHGPTVRLETVVPEHPILNSIPEFESYGSLYKNPSLRDDTSMMTRRYTTTVHTVSAMRFRNIASVISFLSESSHHFGPYWVGWITTSISRNRISRRTQRLRNL